MYLNPLDNLAKSFETMESKGKINLSIIGELDSIIDHCIAVEKYWLSEFSENYNTFTIYHSVRNIKLSTNKIKERVLTSGEKLDNPQIAIDALEILPIMSEIFNFALSLRGESLQYSVINHIQKLTRSLRAKSSKLSLLPTFEDEIKDINIEVIRSSFIKLTEKVQEDINDI